MGSRERPTHGSAPQGVRVMSANLTVANVSRGLSGMGQRLREIRLERGISLRELARRLEISPSAVSKIETGKMQPSVRTLQALAAEFGLSVDEVFTQQGSPSPSERSVVAVGPGLVVQRADDRPAIALKSGVVLARLMFWADEDVELVEATYAPGGSSASPYSLARCNGHEFGYVLTGTLRVVVGSDRVVLSAGDSIALPSSAPHRLFNDGPEQVRAIWVVRGERPNHGLEEPGRGTT
jgi:transcriptional regulator with XRE-family HTH domain